MKLTTGKALLLASAIASLAGCATSRGELNVMINQGDNPAGDKFVTIASVTDSRTFVLKAHDPSEPTLRDGKIDDKSLTSRAVARKRNTYGKALGDILLPENRTVADIVREATVKALRDKGYIVVDKDSPDFAKATPLSLTIKEFWCWISPGALTVALEHREIVDLSGTGLFVSGDSAEATGYIRLKSAAAGTGAWQNILDKGVESYITDLKGKLK